MQCMLSRCALGSGSFPRGCTRLCLGLRATEELQAAAGSAQCGGSTKDKAGARAGFSNKRHSWSRTTTQRAPRNNSSRLPSRPRSRRRCRPSKIASSGWEQQHKALGEKRERLTTLKAYAEALADLHAAGMQEFENGEEGEDKHDGRMTTPTTRTPPTVGGVADASGGTSAGSERKQWFGNNARGNDHNGEGQSKQPSTSCPGL